MITARIRIQLVLFVIIALGATTWLSARYVGLDPFRASYDVTVELPEAGGAFKNGEVTYRGVPVGRVKDLRATSAGTELVIRIDSDAPAIPADVTARVANRSAIGEQYLDLRSESGGDEATLADGDRIVGDADSLPPPIDELLRSGYDFVESVPKDALSTVIDETYELSRGASGHIPRLVETSSEFAEIADRNFLVTKSLIESSTQVLETQHEAAASMRAYSSDLKTLATTLAETDQPLRSLIKHTPAAAREVSTLMHDVGGPLGELMANLVTTAQIFGINSDGVEDALIRLPDAISAGYAVTNSQGLNLGLVQTYFDPLPCTSGYGGTEVRQGLKSNPGKPFNTQAGCTLDPSSGANVRGPRSVRVASELSDLLGGDQ
ncbi:phospholipid/cholesterol/gamma-HCH transport system substrate-binding protein [Nocardioides daedukensis]|uniref:Phospholipid/cholesterol/gamma-HCH transport system substrate-binding protein n=1 Tax=Nocardioides daedukensis TaxID=634462 RepID=A0A7Y9UU56_9ACTN|nr:MlaD family protein [Nocardioides daedukensis]NYG60029.1 phospholipid/cholesterol/gamma-HCH transport system substrate-binding protein [Nocardioides daedukensis]